MGDYSLVAPSASRLKSRSINSGVVLHGSRMARPVTQRRKMKQRQVNKTILAQADELESVSQDNIIISSETKGKQVLFNTSLSHKYQPRVFQELVGHEVVVTALSNAAHKKKVAPLYLFHGPNGTGKTSTARIFAMALNCESTFHNKPCCACKGCSRSLYTMELCSGNRVSGFDKIKTLLQNTSFTQAIPGLKVLIIEECQSFTCDDWVELMSIVEGPYGSTLVFILITIDANSVTTNISSRCQKFYFSKLKDEDVTMKLSRILVRECMRIEKEALKLIVAKSEGSLRNAENILDQLALLGPTIDTSVTQQLVGLIPQHKLTDFLEVVVSGDTINTIRYAKELSKCVEPLAFVSQMATLITDILSGSTVLDSSTDKKLLTSKTQSERLCDILKVIVETEKQLRSSSDQTSSMIAAFLDITSREVIEEVESIEERQQKASLSDMEKLWKDVVDGIENWHTKKFLRHQVKLVLLSISRTNATVHLGFKRAQDKMAAEISEACLAKALEVAIGCPVTVHMNLEPPNANINSKSQSSEGLRLTKSTSQQHNTYSSKTLQPQKPASGYHLGSQDPQTQTMRANRPRHRWLSLSSIPQSDASVEPYSQDVIYENFKKNGRKSPKFQKVLSKSSKESRFRKKENQLQSNPTLCSLDICC